MSRPPYFAFYPTDFADDLNVASMTTLCVGAYVLLLCKAWQAEPPASLPNDDLVLAQLARVDAVAWAEIKPGLLRCFTLGADGRLHNKRLRQEYDKALRLIRAKETAGKKGATNRWNKPKANGGEGRNDGRPNGSAIGTAMAEPMPRQCAGNAIQNQIQNQRKEKKEEPPQTSVLILENGSEIYTPPKLDHVREMWNGIDGVTHCEHVSLDLRRYFGAACLRPLFCEKWQEGVERVRKSSWCHGNNKDGWRASLEWFVRDGSLEKVLNGNYENKRQTSKPAATPVVTPKQERIAAAIAKISDHPEKL